MKGSPQGCAYRVDVKFKIADFFIKNTWFILIKIRIFAVISEYINL